MLSRSVRGWRETSLTQLGGLSTKRVQTVARHQATGRPENGLLESLHIADKVIHLKDLTLSSFSVSRKTKNWKKLLSRSHVVAMSGRSLHSLARGTKENFKLMWAWKFVGIIFTIYLSRAMKNRRKIYIPTSIARLTTLFAIPIYCF